MGHAIFLEWTYRFLWRECAGTTCVRSRRLACQIQPQPTLMMCTSLAQIKYGITVATASAMPTSTHLITLVSLTRATLRKQTIVGMAILHTVVAWPLVIAPASDATANY